MTSVAVIIFNAFVGLARTAVNAEDNDEAQAIGKLRAALDPSSQANGTCLDKRMVLEMGPGVNKLLQDLGMEANPALQEARVIPLYSATMHLMCDRCGLVDTKLKKCGAGNCQARYCSRACQKLAWKDHKAECIG